MLRPLLCAAAAGGMAAAVFSTLVQAALWIAFTDAFPAILWRDARLAAAIVLGPGVLPPPATPDWTVMAVSSALHFALSLAYGFAFCLVARAVGWRRPGTVGALLGALLFLANMYGFTALFPWFKASRDWITFAAHLAFGASATIVGKIAYGRTARP